MRKWKPTRAMDSLATKKVPATIAASATASETELIYAARLQRRLGISNVTLWRWRHDDRLGFPKGRLINRRVYFPWHEVAAWLDRQQKVA